MIDRLFGLTLALSLGFLCWSPNNLRAQDYERYHDSFPGISGGWAEATLHRMTRAEKIGQLFMVPAYTNARQNNTEEVAKLIDTYHIGGVIFMQGGPRRQLRQANRFQEESEVPLLIAQDAEWGPAMRLDSTMSFPKNLTLGAVPDAHLLRAFGRELGRQCRALGVRVNFAPVVDINNNPHNPVINRRSFGEFKGRVIRHGWQVAKGMQEEGVMATAKHFPGHGDTKTDSHHDLPVISHSRQRLHNLELAPFRALADSGIRAMMAAHLYVPALDSTPGLPASLSPKAVKELLREQMGFNGLVFTDALNMGGATKHHAPGETEVKALQAGNDVLLFPTDIPKAVKHIKRALATGRLSERELERHVRRILWAKEWLGLHERQAPSPKELMASLHSDRAQRLRDSLYTNAITLTKNAREALPVEEFGDKEVAYVQIGYDKAAPFHRYLERYGPVDYVQVPADASRAAYNRLHRKLKEYDQVIAGVFQLNHRAGRNYGFKRGDRDFLERLSGDSSRLSLVLFGSPYLTQQASFADAVLVAYEEALPAQRAAAEVVMGARRPRGELPVEPPPGMLQRAELSLGGPRYRQGRAQDLGFHPDTLARIDSIARHYIDRKAMPGCAVMILKGNQIAYAKGIGHTTYADSVPIDPQRTMYDLASVTKVTTTALVAMRLWEEGRLHLDSTVAHYLPEYASHEKGHLTIAHLMKHKAGLVPHIPLWTVCVQDGQLNKRICRRVRSKRFDIPLKKNLFLKTSYRDSALQKIKPLDAHPNANVRYSDIGIILLGEILEKLLDEPLIEYAQRTFYEPLGMSLTAFNPALKDLPDSVIIPPTIKDTYFRHQVVQGFVNDENAAVLGGYAGNAGMFSTTFDLAKLALMLKNGGRMAGKRYFKEATLEKFTARQDGDSRRGLIWDKPETDSSVVTPVSRRASFQTFGHLGYTGISFWIDPHYELTYILLTNRTFPKPGNNLYGRESVRIQIMDMAYRALALPRWHRTLMARQFYQKWEEGNEPIEKPVPLQSKRGNGH